MSPTQINSSELEKMPSNEVSIVIKERELWEKFRNFTNEMIVTKTGSAVCTPSRSARLLYFANVSQLREGWEYIGKSGYQLPDAWRMFPVLKAGILNMESNSMYTVLLEFVHVDEHRMKYDNGAWKQGSKSEVTHSKSIYTHPDSPNYGAHWMRDPICFSKVKLSNKMSENKQQVMLNSLHKYEPRVHVVKVGLRGEQVTIATKSFPETQFVAVTAYQNEEITSLKIKYNPFAKAFQDAKERPDQRKHYDTGIKNQKHLTSVANSWMLSNGQSPLLATQQLSNGYHTVETSSCDRLSMRNNRTAPYQLQRCSGAEAANSSRNYETWTLPSQQTQYGWPVHDPSSMSSFQVCGKTTSSPYNTAPFTPSIPESVASCGSPSGSYSNSGSGFDSLPMPLSSQNLREHFNWNTFSTQPVYQH